MSRDAGVYLTVPEGAVRQGSNIEMFLAVLRDDKDRPKLSGPSFTSYTLLLVLLLLLKLLTA